jgi:hypothetical protein
MGLRRTCVGVLPLVLGGLLALPAAGSAPPPSGARPGPGDREAAAVQVRSDGSVERGRSPLDALTGGARDLASLLRLTADASTAGTEQREVLVGTAEEPQAFAAAVPAGDLDGDGLADLVTYRGDDTSLWLDARRGTDGRPLWSQDLSADGALVFPVGRDLTGDGLDDLVVDAVDAQVSHEERADGYRFTAVLAQTYGVVSGADGSGAWRQTTNGSFQAEGRYTGDPLGLAEQHAESVRARDLVLPLLSPDLTGDGADDLAVSEISFDYTDEGTSAATAVAGAFLREAALRGSTRLLAVDGRAGGARELRATRDVAGVSYALPVGALSGRSADLLLVTETLSDANGACADVAVPAQTCVGRPFGTAGTTVERLDGRTGTSRWSLAVDDPAVFAFPLGADADGDGTGDIVLEQLFQGRVSVVSGATGRALWEVVDEGSLPFLVGVEDGVAVLGGLDVSFEDGGDEATLLVRRVAARDGALLSEVSRSVPLARVDEDASFRGVLFYAGRVGDGDGDAGSELLLGTESFALGFSGDPFAEDQGPVEPTSEDFASSVVVEPFAGGAPLLAEASDDLRFVLPFGDLDGDGLADVARLVSVGEQRDGLDLTALRLVDGGALWRSGPGDELALPAGDQDGVPGVELLGVVHGEDGPQVRSLRGADLGERWRVPAAPGPGAAVSRPLPSSG